MTVEELIEELKKMPPQAAHQEVLVNDGNGASPIRGVSWQGNHTEVEGI